MSEVDQRRLIDLSMPIEEHWRFTPSFETKLAARPQFTFHSTIVKMGAHGFSHVDAPFHVDQAMDTIEKIDLEHFWGPASIIDLSDLGDNAEYSREVLEPRAENVQSGDIVLLRSDQERRHPTTEKEYWTASPWVSLSGARFLLECGAKGVAFDFPQDRSIRAAYDPAYVPSDDPDEDEACHLVLLPKTVLQFEYLRNFAAIDQPRFIFMGLPLKIVGSDGGPVRAVAMEGVQNV
ncbi:cyclase family protein [Propionimicrobium sp. PCR01-08-3]|uniref:cyclase family protein n=1 Tax=Propionimicrobium sp. PCR01-08-3 TaxID=3052086 RepID=UPI00255CD28E|nr:cyclase family protein [Propionimicrobium sp. PCR01-08-3]WIY83480.1 cyclase family protein [Propionimicrobium sp. PCR01-08-3]